MYPPQAAFYLVSLRPPPPLHPCRLDFAVGVTRFTDQFVWDVNNPSASPELFAAQLARDVGLEGTLTVEVACKLREQVGHSTACSAGRHGTPTCTTRSDGRCAWLCSWFCSWLCQQEVAVKMVVCVCVCWCGVVLGGCFCAGSTQGTSLMYALMYAAVVHRIAHGMGAE